ncbi:MAG: heavy metal translocating P-type ATPase [Hyphomonadaceae bacterium]
MTIEAEAGCPSGLEPAARGGQVQDPAPFVTRAGDRNALDLLVRGAKCGGCLAKIEKGVGALPGVEVARLNLSNGRMRVEWSGALKAKQVVETVAGLGYSAAAFDPGDADKERLKAERKLLTAMAVAGFGAANIMLLSVSVWAGGADMGPETRQLMHWIAGLIATPVVAFSGRPFFESAYASIKARRLNMDMPITLAVVLAIGMSFYETLKNGPHAYFDAACTLIFFLLIGRFLDARLRRRAYAAANALAAMQTSTATRLAEGGKAEAVRAADIRPGDRLMLAAGEQCPVDALVISPESEWDMRLVTGEVTPVAMREGGTVHAGAVNLLGPVEIKTIARAQDSLMADIARMLEAGEQKKSAYRRIADKASEIYVPTVHIVALLAFVGWLVAGAGLERAVFTAVTVLIITCPCALALAAPVVQVVAAGRLFRDHVYLSSGDALERIAAIDHVVFDKTGTLTLGDPVLTPGLNTETQIELAARLARGSRHPFSRALVRAAGAGVLADQIEEHPGSGVTGLIDGVPARLGKADFVGVDDAGSGSSLWFRRGDEAPVCFRFSDVTRPEAADTVAQLKLMGVSSEVLSGDSEERVALAARAVGVDRWTSQASPRTKAERLDQLEREGRKVLMVGDGLNDAGALAKAHASIAPGGAVDVSRLAADCVFSGDSIGSVVRIVRIARKARALMLENFGFSALYNLVAVPIALAGWATPMVAAIAMSGSSLIVTLNALRLSGRLAGGGGTTADRRGA